jgi:arsenate reductase-like glutaredoxin family protein
MAAGNPPGWRIDYLARHWQSATACSSESSESESYILEVQVFGIRKSADTRKALRFFSERRVRTHFVDLMERPASLGELRRFAQKFGVSALVDRDSRQFEELGLRYAQLSDERWLEKLSEHPLLLRIPLVRNANQLTIGTEEAIWKGWVGR